MPKLSGTGLKLGRMKFVSKKNNGNGNANGQGIIVSFIPFQSFTGDISKVSTSNFRVMNFDGIIAFNELNGCSGNAYKVDKGVVMNKLTIATPNQLNPRCGESYTSTTYHYTMVSSPAYPQNGCSISYYAAGTSTSYGVPCLDAPMVGSGGNYGNSSASSNDATYSGYLAPPPISVLCTFSIANGLSAPQSTGSFTTGSGNGCLPSATRMNQIGIFVKKMLT